jgi:hypothetical protein
MRLTEAAQKLFGIFSNARKRAVFLRNASIDETDTGQKSA